MNLPSTNRVAIAQSNFVKLWIYGAPFSGKTTLADKSDTPLNLNTDGNVKYVSMPRLAIKDEVTTTGRITKRKYAWEVFTEAIDELEKATANNDGLHFQIALNYGSRDEIIRAVKKIMLDTKNGVINPQDMTEELFSTYLDTKDIPEPDLMIRTSGEERISNFLLWQLAYTEFYFTDVPWPAFSKEELEKAIAAYNARDRRYGNVKEE